MVVFRGGLMARSIKLKSPINKKSETEILGSILDGLQLMGKGAFYRINNAPVFDKKTGNFRRKSKHAVDGISDILGCYKGKFAAIEVKTVSEYNRVVRFLTFLHEQNISTETFIDSDKWKMRIVNQANFIKDIIKQGGIGFFTYSLDHTIEKLEKLA